MSSIKSDSRREVHRYSSLAEKVGEINGRAEGGCEVEHVRPVLVLTASSSTERYKLSFLLTV